MIASHCLNKDHWELKEGHREDVNTAECIHELHLMDMNSNANAIILNRLYDAIALHDDSHDSARQIAAQTVRLCEIEFPAIGSPAVEIDNFVSVLMGCLTVIEMHMNALITQNREMFEHWANRTASITSIAGYSILVEMVHTELVHLVDKYVTNAHPDPNLNNHPSFVNFIWGIEEGERIAKALAQCFVDGRFADIPFMNTRDIK